MNGLTFSQARKKPPPKLDDTTGNECLKSNLLIYLHEMAIDESQKSNITEWSLQLNALNDCQKRNNTSQNLSEKEGGKQRRREQN